MAEARDNTVGKGGGNRKAINVTVTAGLASRSEKGVPLN